MISVFRPNTLIMHKFQLFIALASVSGITALAHPGVQGHKREPRTHGTCQQFDVPISTSSENSIFNLTYIDDDIELTNMNKCPLKA